MRTRVVLPVVASATLVVIAAHADEGASENASDSILTRHRLGEEPAGEPLLHLDTTPLAAEAAGGIIDGRAAVLDLGPRARLAAEGRWWQTGLAPSMFAEDLPYSGWRAATELTYDLGPFSVGINASMTHEGGTSHRMVGLFAFKRFRLSRWMRAWITLGIAYEQWQFPGPAGQRNGVTAGLTLGTTFR